MVKTPDEIKKGLECCCGMHDHSYCRECPYSENDCDEMSRDALAYIQQLERERDEAMHERDGLSMMLTSAESAFETMKCERDEAVKALSRYMKCIDCKYRPIIIETYGFCKGCESGSNWQWRGAQEEA